MNLKSQKRLAADILKVGLTRVWLNPEMMDDVDGAITRAEIRKLVHEGTIRAKPKKGVSRARARVLHEKKKRGLRKGVGSRTGAKYARVSRKERWMIKIRAIRKHLRALKMRRVIRKDAYRKLYLLAKGGTFSSVRNVDQYIEANDLARRR